MFGYSIEKRLAVTLLVLLATLLWSAAGLGIVYAQCPGNILVNPNFEEGFSERGAGEVKVANGWQPFWQDGPMQDEGYNHRPEYQPEDAARFGRRRVREGNWAQKMFTTFSTHHGGIYQQVNVPPGSTLRLSAWAQAWSSDKDDPAVSSGGKYYMTVGIDPTGGTNFNSPAIVWSAPSTALDTWVQLAVEAKAQAGTVTVFLRGDAEWRVKHNDVYFDEACLTVAAPPPTAMPRPRPTDTPVPTSTPTPEPTDTPAPAPKEPEAPLTPDQEAGTIRVVVFDDLNGNGFRDTGEPLLTGAEVSISYFQGATLATIKTDGSAGPIVLEGLQPGNYVVSEKAPDGYVPTSPSEWAVTLLSGADLELHFGSQFAPTATPAMVAASPTMPAAEVVVATPSPEGLSAVAESGAGGALQAFGDALYGVSGLLVAGLAFVLPLALRFLRGPG